MDWKTLATTFGAIFVAELGDKTQLATLTLSAEARTKWAVFVGSALALVATSAIAVLAGAAVTRVIPRTGCGGSRARCSSRSACCIWFGPRQT